MQSRPSDAKHVFDIKMKIEFVDLKRQLFGQGGIAQEVQEAMNRVVDNTSFIMGPELERFEKAFAAYCGAGHCVGLNSGTDALEFALRCNGITGGNVITVPNSYFTTASSITQAGATPVFVDVDRRSYNINVSELERKIDADTKAVILVHLYGRPAEMGSIMRVAAERGIKVIEDCAHAPGAAYMGRTVPFSGTGAFSFFPGKNIGAFGDGGALVTNDADVAHMAKLWRNDGWEKKYHHEIIGRKARLDSLQAAVLDVKLKHLDMWNAQRLEHARMYNSLLSDVDALQLPLLDDSAVKPVFHIYNVLTDKRDELAMHLESAGISAGIHYPVPIHLQPAYKNLNIEEGSFPVAESLAKRTLSLPMFPELREDEIRYICNQVRSFFSRQVL